MVLDCDTWCNRNLPHGKLIEFVPKKFNQYLGMYVELNSRLPTTQAYLPS
jgi:hypothetical protein